MEELIIDGLVWGVESYTSWLGRRLDNVAGLMERTAETLRFIAILTRATP